MYKFGDIEVDSFQELFDPDSDLWGRKKLSGYYRFNDRASEVWAESILTGLILDNEHTRPTLVLLAADSSSGSTLFDKLTEEFTDQFGPCDPVQYTHPQFGPIKYKNWWFTENDGMCYVMMMAKVKDLIILPTVPELIILQIQWIK